MTDMLLQSQLPQQHKTPFRRGESRKETTISNLPVTHPTMHAPMAAAAARDPSCDASESTRRCISDDVYEHDDSLKENTNPKCVLKNTNNLGGQNGNGASQRFSGNLKLTAAPIIGISGKLGQGCLVRRNHNPPSIFPKKAKTGGGGRKPKPAVPEPGSPKDSCIGKVLSGRERDNRSSRPPRSPETSGGCCPGFGFLIRRSRSRKRAVECVDWSPPPQSSMSVVPRRGGVEKGPTEEEAAPVPAPAPVLGGMRRFSSGRRAADWAGQMEVDRRVAKSEPL